MRTSKKLALAAALTAMGIGGANASIIIAQSATGSESILSVVNKTTNASVMQDLGELRADVLPGDAYTLDQVVLDFITAAGGLSNISFAVTGGGALNSTAAGQYLHSSSNANLDTGSATDGPANSIRGGFLTSRQSLVTGLNNTNIDDTDTANNLAYGPFSAGAPNYTANNAYRWGIASGPAATTFNTLGDAVNDLFLYTIQFGSTSTGNGNVIDRLAKASLDLNNPEFGSRLVISAVPVPAAVWLMGSALGLLSVVRRRVRG